MFKRFLGLTILTLMFCFAVVPFASAQKRLEIDDLPIRYQKWLTEEVVYILTKTEKNAFLQLQSNEMRDLFIETFWDKRDPTPGTHQNEFREEHYERIEFANKHFSFIGSNTGWRSDRGRIYIIMGEPKERLEYANNTFVYPCELWFYSGDDRVQTSQFFYMIFYQRNGAGDYVIYHPAIDKPDALTWKGNWDEGDEEVQKSIEYVSPELARASISLNPFDNSPLASEVLLHQVESWPERAIDSSWAERFVETKGQVQVQYSFRPIDLRAKMFVQYTPDFRQQLHYAFMLKPEEIEIGQYDDRFYAAFEVIPSIADENGQLLYEGNSVMEMNWSLEQYQVRRSKPLVFKDVIPVVPGKYLFTLRVRNKVSRAMYMVNQDIYVLPPSLEVFHVNPLMLSHRQEQAEATDNFRYAVPFRIFGIDYSPNLLQEFAKSDNLHVYTQLSFPPTTHAGKNVGEISVKFNLSRGDELVSQLTHIIPAQKANDFGVAYLSRQIPLEELELGEYHLEIIATDSKSQKADKRSTYFTLKEPYQIARPVYVEVPRRDMNVVQRYLEIRADMYMKLKNVDMAIREYQQALIKDSQNVDITVKLGKALSQKGKLEEAMKVVRAIEWKEPNNRELIKFLGETSAKLNKLDDAIGFYERYLFVNPEDTGILNLVANLYEVSGDNAKALEKWQKSLSVNPDQPNIKQKVSR